MVTDSRGYHLTDNLILWRNDDLIRFAYDTSTLMGLEKFEIVKIAQELASRYDEQLEELEDGD